MYIFIVCVVCVCASRKRDMAESAMEGSLRESLAESIKGRSKTKVERIYESWPKASKREREREREGWPKIGHGSRWEARPRQPMSKGAGAAARAGVDGCSRWQRPRRAGARGGLSLVRGWDDRGAP